LPSSLSTEIALLEDLDEEQEEDEDLLACLLVGEYLSGNTKGQYFM